MPVSAINASKELALGFQPLLLATITFTDGTILRLSTHGLRAADGGFQYAGNDYLPRILNQDIAAIQALSDQGIDIPPSVTLSLDDADCTLWTNYEVAKGFKGAKLELTFVFHNAGANEFSPDSVSKFVGICSAPQLEETTLSLSATSLMNMQQSQLPTIRIQRRCPWVFPATAAQRQEGADSEDSWFYECGYSPDATGGNARGNLNGGVPFTSCNYTKEQCVSRGMYSKDSLVRITGRFGGVQWDPPESWRGRAHGEPKFSEGFNTSNEAKYNDCVPFVYGTAWVEPIITNVCGSANYTTMEAILCYGEIDDVVRVIVNDTEVPAATRIDGTALKVTDWLFQYRVVNRGTRNGVANTAPIYDGKGDPYGSFATLAITVPKMLSDSQNVPRVRVLVRGPKIRKYTNTTTFTKVGAPDNLNPAWILLDVLIWSNWNYADIDIQSFIDAAAICDAGVTFKDQRGLNTVHARYMGSLVLRSRKAAGEIVRGLRNLMKAVLVPNSSTGKLSLRIKQTLAAQQSATISGSNYNTAVASKLASGSAGNGYSAYKFDESNIIRRGGKSTLKITQLANSETPNRVTVTFQDAHNNFAADSLSVVDGEALVRCAQQEIVGSFPLEGLNNFDQGRRVIGTFLAERFRGNSRNPPLGDAGGTLQFEFETTFKAVHLSIGQLCLLSYASRGITNQPIRITRLKPSTNYEFCTVTATWHSDEWYLDSFGQEDAPRYSGSRRNNLARPPFPLNSIGNTYNASNLSAQDPMYGTERFFGLVAYDSPRLAITFPQNEFSPAFRPPFVPNEGTTAPTGGSLAGNRVYYIYLVAKDAAGKLSAPSNACRIAVPAGTATNTITVPEIDCDTATSSVLVYLAEDDSYRPWQMAEVSGAPTSVTFTGPIDRSGSWPPIPDPEFNSFKWKIKRVRNAGVFGSEITGETSNTITVQDARWTVNQWAGYDCSIIGERWAGTGWDSPFMRNFRVASNTVDTLTLASSDGGITFASKGTLGVGPGANFLLIMRTKPTAFTSNSITEPNFDNSLALSPDANHVYGATNASPIVIESPGHDLLTGDRARGEGVGGNTAANAIFTVTKIDADHFSLNGSTGNGAYTSGGMFRKLTGGLNADEAKGKLLRIIAGKGRGHVYKIRSNTATAITIEGEWLETPDATTRFITEEPDWIKTIETSALNISAPAGGGSGAYNEFEVDWATEGQRTLLIMGVPIDGGGNEAFEQACQVRDVYLFNLYGIEATNLGNGLSLSVNGTLAIGADLAPLAAFNVDATPKRVRAMLKQAPIGGPTTVKVYVGGTVWATLSIPAGSYEAEDLNPPAIAADDQIRLDITGVGTTFPGSDLSVLIYV